MNLTRVRCTGCRNLADTNPCWRCGRTCARKRNYPSYNSARDVRDLMAERDNDPILDVYPCPIGDHFHIGHASGFRARLLMRRTERQRRKRLTNVAQGQLPDQSPIDLSDESVREVALVNARRGASGRPERCGGHHVIYPDEQAAREVGRVLGLVPTPCPRSRRGHYHLLQH